MNTKQLLLSEPQTKEDRLVLCRRAVEASGLNPDAVLQAAWNQGLVLALAAEAIGVDTSGREYGDETRQLHLRAMGHHPPERMPWEMRTGLERRKARDLVRRMQEAGLVLKTDAPENQQ
jgi:hypothetical protein